MARESELIRICNGDHWDDDKLMKVTEILLARCCDLRRVRMSLAGYGVIRLGQAQRQVQQLRADEWIDVR